MENDLNALEARFELFEVHELKGNGKSFKRKKLPMKEFWKLLISKLSRFAIQQIVAYIGENKSYVWRIDGKVYHITIALDN